MSAVQQLLQNCSADLKAAIPHTLLNRKKVKAFRIIIISNFSDSVRKKAKHCNFNKNAPLNVFTENNI